MMVEDEQVRLKAEENIKKALLKRMKTGNTYGFLAILVEQIKIALRQPTTWFFNIGIPAVMYLLFGTNESYANFMLPHGNVSAQVMVSLAQYSVAVTGTTVACSVAISHVKGWLRTIRLTPLGLRAWLVAKILSGIFISALNGSIIYLLGFCLNAQMERMVWVETFLLLLVLAIIPVLIGLIIANLVRSEEAYGILGGGLSLLAFFSGMFIPLNQLGMVFQTIAKFTPLWGSHQLVIAPLSGWGKLGWEQPLNIGIWLIVLLGLTGWSLRWLDRR